MTGECHRCQPVAPLDSLARCPAVKPALRVALGQIVTERERQERDTAELRAVIERARVAHGRLPVPPAARGWAAMGRGAGI